MPSWIATRRSQRIASLRTWCSRPRAPDPAGRRRGRPLRRPLGPRRPVRIYLLGHSEGTQVAANLAAAATTYGIPEPAGVLGLGVVGHEIRTLMTYQFFGVKLARLHDEFDVGGDGYLTYPEARDGLVGQPAAEADEYRKVLIPGKQVNPGTDGDRDGRLAIDTEVGPVLRAASGVEKLATRPGKIFAYSNTNYVLAGLVAQRVTGRPIAELVTKRIIEPLGLRDTYWPADAS